jgi:hypothetical protein
MSKALKRLGIAILIIGIVISLGMSLYKYPVATQVPYDVQVPYQATETQTQNLDHKENYQIQTGHYAYSKFDLQTGDNLVVSWQTDNTVSVYITNPAQFSSAALLGSPMSSLARKTMTPSGTLSYQVPSAGTYYVIISPYLNDVNVASYKSELQWQEQVTKFRTETNYRTETIYTSSTFGINLGITVLVVGSITTALSFINIKPLVKKAKNINTVTCNYCNTTYNKTLEKCPHCGARKKIA